MSESAARAFGAWTFDYSDSAPSVWAEARRQILANLQELLDTNMIRGAEVAP